MIITLTDVQGTNINQSVVWYENNQSRPVTALDIARARPVGDWICSKCRKPVESGEIVEVESLQLLQLSFRCHGTTYVTKLTNMLIRNQGDIARFNKQLETIRPFAPAVSPWNPGPIIPDYLKLSETVKYKSTLESYQRAILEDIQKGMALPDIALRSYRDLDSYTSFKPNIQDFRFICQLCQQPIKNVQVDNDYQNRSIRIGFRCHGRYDEATIEDMRFQMNPSIVESIRPFLKDFEALNNPRPAPVATPVKPPVLVLAAERIIKLRE